MPITSQKSEICSKDEINQISRFLNDYAKGFYLYERTLLTYVKGNSMSNFAMKGFQSIKYVLQNKFQKTTVPKNFL